MNPNAHEPWLETLQGRGSVTDRETHEAQGMRQYFETRLQADLVPLNDPARERRLRNLVEAHFAADALSATQQAKKPLSPLSAWLQSCNFGWPSLGASAAAVVLGVLIVPLWQNQHSVDDDRATPKTLPSVQPGSTPHGVTRPEFNNSSAATNPQEFANLVRLALTPLGIEITVLPAADGMHIYADIPEEKRNAAAQALKPLGLALPAGSRLHVLVR